MDKYPMQDRPAVSVVIPTIGEDSLESTILALNNGTLVPAEIIICIPKDKSGMVNHLVSENTWVLATEVKGQVAQRIEGFKVAKHDYVLQLDCDCVIAPDGIEELIKAQKLLGRDVAISPNWPAEAARADSEAPAGAKFFFKKLLNLMIDNRMNIPAGAVTKAGVETWPPFSSGDTFCVQSEWLPGGCVLHSKENLVLEDYYPFKGKAYGEDVIHSIMLRRKNIKLFICKTAAILHEGVVEETFSSFKAMMTFLRKTTKYRHKIVKLVDGSYPRLWIWLLNFYTANIIRFYRVKFRSQNATH
jgi:glycosyltransferase involved in cell wall biosynthesis